MNGNKKRITSTVSAIALAGLVLGSAACGDDAGSDSTTAPVTVEISDAWARTSPMEVTLGAAYMTITSPVDDRLTDVSVDPSIAGTAEIHEMVMAMSSETSNMMSSETMSEMSSETTGMMSSDTTVAGSGEMVMQEVDSIAIPAGEPVQLKPGGYHIMLIDLVAPLETGRTFDIVLTFETAGRVTVPVVVADEAP